MNREYSIEDVNGLLDVHYGLKGTLKKLGSYRDRNFLLKTGGEVGPRAKFIVKISIRVDDNRPLLLQNYVLKKLESQKFEFKWKFPQIRQAKDHGDMITIASPHGTDFMRVLSFVEGHQMEELTDAPLHIFDQAGELAAHMSLFLERLSEDEEVAELNRQIKDQSHFFNLLKFNEHYETKRKYLDGEAGLAVDRIKTEFNEVLPLLQGMPKQLVHHDMCLTNLLTAKDQQSGEYFVSGLIDFCDIAETHGIIQLAILSARINLYRPQPLRNMLRVIVAFNKVRKLSQSEKGILFTLIKARLAELSMTSTSVAAQKVGNHYFQRCKNGHLLYLMTFANACTNAEFVELLEEQISKSS